MERITELERENERLRAAYEMLEQQNRELERELRETEMQVSDLASGFPDDMAAEEPVYLASSRRQTFHRQNCEWAGYIVNSPNVIEFGSHREAVEAGYKPCKTCRA